MMKRAKTSLVVFFTLLAMLVTATALANPISSDGYFKGIKLCGKVKVVTSFPDLKVKIVESFPDLKVQVVESFPDKIGKWQFVDSFPDFTVQFVSYGEDIKIKYVNSFPGVN